MPVQASFAECHATLKRLRRCSPTARIQSFDQKRVSAPSVNTRLRGSCLHSLSSNVSPWTSAHSYISEAARNAAAFCFYLGLCHSANERRGPSFSIDDSCIDFVAIESVAVDKGGYQASAFGPI